MKVESLRSRICRLSNNEKKRENLIKLCETILQFSMQKFNLINFFDRHVNKLN